MEEFKNKYYQTPFRTNEIYCEGSTIDQSAIRMSYEEKRNFVTPKKFYSHKYQKGLNEAPKKTSNFESKQLDYDAILLNKQLFSDNNVSFGEDEIDTDYHKLQKITGALIYYKIDNYFILQGFLEWLLTFNDVKDILLEIVDSFLKGFNEKSNLFFKFFNKGTFLEIIDVELNDLNSTLVILENNVKQFSEDYENSQIDAKDEKLFFSIKGTYTDRSLINHSFILTYKITLIHELLSICDAKIKDVLRIDYIKIKLFN